MQDSLSEALDASWARSLETQGRRVAAQETAIVDVLLVDDDQVFAEFAMSVLRWSKHRVTWIADGEAARLALCGADASIKPRLILLDIEMPGLDGLGLLEDIAHSEVRRHSSVVMLTRHTMAEDIIRAHKLGAVDYLAKPLPAATLVQRVNRALAA